MQLYANRQKRDTIILTYKSIKSLLQLFVKSLALNFRLVSE